MTNMCRGITSRGEPCKRKTCNDNHLCNYHQGKPLQDKPDECPICLESLENMTKPLECGHWIHIDCVAKSMKPECPVCRKVIKLPKKILKTIDENERSTRREWEAEDSSARELALENIYINIYDMFLGQCVCPRCYDSYDSSIVYSSYLSEE